MKVKFGLSNVHIAKLTEDAEGNITYGKPFPLKGAVKLNTDPEGEKVAFKADNITYYNSVNNQGYTGDLEVALVNKEFLKDILGRIEDSNGALFENADDVISRFALMGEIEGDVQKRRFIYYDCVAGRPSTEDKTVEDSKEPNTETINISMNPRTSDHMVKCDIERNETNKTVFDAFYESGYEKAA